MNKITVGIIGIIALVITPLIAYGGMIGPANTDSLTEGATNQYHTNERVDDRANALINAVTPLGTTYDDPNNRLDITANTVCHMLNSNTTSYSTPADTDEHNAIVYVLPANTLANNGDFLEIAVYAKSAANANTKRLRVYFGSTVISDTGAYAGNNVAWITYNTLFRTGAATQYSASTRFVSNLVNTVPDQAPTETLSGAVTVKVTATNGAANAGDMVVNAMTVKLCRSQ